MYAPPFFQNINRTETISNLHYTNSQNKYMELEELQKEKNYTKLLAFLKQKNYLNQECSEIRWKIKQIARQLKKDTELMQLQLCFWNHYPGLKMEEPGVRLRTNGRSQSSNHGMPWFGLMESKYNKSLRINKNRKLNRNIEGKRNQKWILTARHRKYYWSSRPFKFGSEFRSKEMKGWPFFLSFLKNLHEKLSAFHFLGSEFRSKNEKPIVAIIVLKFLKHQHEVFSNRFYNNY